MNTVDATRPYPRFHHPDFCPTVFYREAADLMLEMIGGWGTAMLTGGRSLTWAGGNTERKRMASALRRLRKAGLLVSPSRRGSIPLLQLTPRGQERITAEKAQRRWDHRWNGIWYTLIYDVPEKDRRFRHGLRSYLQRLRLGRLQQSAWVTPFDIRPDYQDLREAASLDACALLVEARTVLGYDSQRIVRTAWPLDRIHRMHARFLRYSDVLRSFIAAARRPRVGWFEAGRRATALYRRAFDADPMLPRSLFPPGYLGERAAAVFGPLMRDLGERMSQSD